MIVVRSYEAGLSGARARNPHVELSVEPAPALQGQPVLWVEYPEPTGDPAGRPYFQPPGADTGKPIDLSEVRAIGFAPQDQRAGRLAISRFVVVD